MIEIEGMQSRPLSEIEKSMMKGVKAKESKTTNISINLPAWQIFHSPKTRLFWRRSRKGQLQVYNPFTRPAKWESSDFQDYEGNSVNWEKISDKRFLQLSGASSLDKRELSCTV